MAGIKVGDFSRYRAEPGLAAKLTTLINEAIAAHCAAGQGRLLGLGTIPLRHPDLAVRELRRAMGELGLRGVSVSTNVDNDQVGAAVLDAAAFVSLTGAAGSR